MDEAVCSFCQPEKEKMLSVIGNDRPLRELYGGFRGSYLLSRTTNIFADLNQEYLDIPFGRSPGTPGLHGSNQRTKRMRTSFKHHQLRTMKSYFAINHNPDAKDLKQLSQKTGLPKRVLQVWFQNARAKWRRMMLKQEGKSGEKCSGSESISDMEMYGGPGGPASIGMQPHSPPFLLPGGAGSPSSLDCS
ncbi:protein apterous-like [Sitophilus oryzae]|uniref:Protein apterous-like n=1 Tax=Sitophilus oryzae TaxID=7048 RepID=A0A6J2YLU2_SITOR|nr:protein apterous-like [Sitophilus oryzae]